MPKEIKENWEKGFRKKFGRFYIDDQQIDWERGELNCIPSDDIEDFIRQLLSQQKQNILEAVVEIIEKMKIKYPDYHRRQDWNNYNQAFSDLIAILKKEQIKGREENKLTKE